jgi:nitrous-oxide reductase
LIMLPIAAAVFLLTGSLATAETGVEKGEVLFNDYGCAGCHIYGQTWSAPDISKITTYYPKEKLLHYIENTTEHYNDPVVRKFAEKYARYMGDHDVSHEDAELIYQYLESLAKKK